MGCCTGFARFILIALNFVFWLTGVALLGVGIWILVDPDVDEYQDVIEDASSDGDFLKVAAYILIGFGAFIFLVGFCGCCGAIRKSKCLLGFYIFFLVVVFAGEIAAVVYVAVRKDSAEDDLQEGLVRSIKEHYKGGLGKAWDSLQDRLDCCGGLGPDDYINSTWASDQTAQSGIKIPPSCCVRENGTPTNLAGCQKRTDPTAYYDKGCKKAIEDWIKDNSAIVIGVGAGFAALQIIVFIFAICFCRNMEKEE